jgi:hypothetical protein
MNLLSWLTGHSLLLLLLLMCHAGRGQPPTFPVC